MKPSVAIVILNFNGKKFLEQFLPSVIASTYSNKRIIVADNASWDESVAFLKSHYLREVEVIELSENSGYAEGYNQALKRIDADYYILLNSDVEVTKDWIEPVIELMESNVAIAACQPKILSWYDKNLFEHAGASGGFIDRYGYPFARGRVFDFCEEDKGQYNYSIPVFWASGAAFFIRSKIFHESGGLDGYFFAHMEEIDLCWRLQLMGYKIFCCPESVVYHVGGGTLPKTNSRKTYLNFRNNLIMLFKNLNRLQRFWKLMVRCLLDTLFFIKNILTGNFAIALAVIKAYFGFFKWVFSKECKISNNRKPLKKLDGAYPGSVVIAYFVKKKKRFSEIISSNL